MLTTRHHRGFSLPEFLIVALVVSIVVGVLVTVSIHRAHSSGSVDKTAVGNYAGLEVEIGDRPLPPATVDAPDCASTNTD